jgi:hypothetical protein
MYVYFRFEWVLILHFYSFSVVRADEQREQHVPDVRVVDGHYVAHQGSILWNSILAENFSDKFSSSNFGQFSTQHQRIKN